MYQVASRRSRKTNRETLVGKEVAAELFSFDHSVEVHDCSGYQANICTLVVRVLETLELFRLPKRGGALVEVPGNVSELIHTQRAVVSHSSRPIFCVRRP